jgi:adenylate kinase family enzyme
MNIVIEGPDNSGKSTLAREIARCTGKQLISSNGKPQDIPARIEAMPMSATDAVFDRHPCVSDLIYSAAARRPPIVTGAEIL